MRSGDDEAAKNSLDSANQYNSSSRQIQSFVDSWLSVESYFESDLSLDVGEIIKIIPRKEISVFGAEDDGAEEVRSERAKLASCSNTRRVNPKALSNAL